MGSQNYYSGIRFESAADRAHFCVEMGLYDLLEQPEAPIPEEVVASFYEQREQTVTLLKDFRQRQQTKQDWRKSRYKHMRGIKKFHRSIQGKKLHRTVGRQVANRIQRGRSTTAGQAVRDKQKDARIIGRAEALAWCKALSSLRTHAFILAENYTPNINEMADVEQFVDYVIPTLSALEQRTLWDPQPWTRDMWEVLLRVVHWHEVRRHLVSAYPTVDWDQVWDVQDMTYRDRCQRLAEDPTPDTYAATTLFQERIQAALELDLEQSGIWSPGEPDYLFPGGAT